jgi:hypothetical protein
VVTSSGYDLELIDGSTVVGLMFARLRDDREGGQPLTIQEALVASGAGQDLAEWLDVAVNEDWFPGIGTAYDAAPGCDTFSSPGYVLPAGAPVDLTLPAARNSGTPLVAIVNHGADIFVAQRGSGADGTARVMRSVNGTAAFVDSLWLGPGEYLRDLLDARDQNGTLHLYAMSSGIFADQGRLHQFVDATGMWLSTPLYPAPGSFGAANGRNRSVKVYWEGEDGIGDWRIVSLASAQGHISYTKPGADPMNPLHWVELVKVGGGEGIGDLVAARRHVWLSSPDNLYDLDELGNSPALTSYAPRHRGNAQAVAYHDGYVYRGLNVGLDRIRVDQGPIIQENQGVCTPGWGTAAESDWLTGYTTALATYAGGVLNATYTTIPGKPAVFWGKDRSVLGIETPNPLVWHGPFIIGATETVITRMLVWSTDATPSMTRLYLAAWSTDQVSQPTLSYVSMPSIGGAMQDLKSAGGSGHTFATGTSMGLWQPYCRIYGMAQTAKDKASVKHIHQLSIGSRGLADPAGTKLVAYVRADPSPSSTDWGTGTDIPTGPSYDITPATTSGHKLETRIDFFSPGGGLAPPKPAILDAIRATVWRIAPDLDTWTFDVEYGEGVLDRFNTPWTSQGRDVDWHTDALIAMARADRVIMRDRQDARWSVKVKHYLPRVSTLNDGMYGRTTTARITVALLGRLS